jgi:tape measure domain-containing protein
LSTSIGDLAVILSADTGRADKALHGFAGRVDKLDAKVRQFGSTSPRMPGLDRAKDKLKGIDGGGGLAMLGPWGAAAAAGLGAATAAAVGLGKALTLAGEAEANLVSFQTLTGDAGVGRKMLADLDAYAAKTAFSSRETAELGKQLLGVGVEADQVMPAIRTFGDIAGTLGGDTTERMKRLTKAFGDVKANGRLAAEELNQFSEAGVNLGDALAKTMGKPRDEIKKLASEGEIGFGEVVAALNSLTGAGGQFAGGAEKFGQTWGGMLGQIGDGTDKAFKTMGQALIEELPLKEVLGEGLKLLDKVPKLIDAARPVLKLIGVEIGAKLKLLSDGLSAAERFGRVLANAGKALFGPELKALMGEYGKFFKDLERFDLEAFILSGAEAGLNALEPFALGVADFIDAAVDGYKRFDRALKVIDGTARATFTVLADGFKMLTGPLDDAISKLKVLGELLANPTKAFDLPKAIAGAMEDLKKTRPAEFKFADPKALAAAGGNEQTARDRVMGAIGAGRKGFADWKLEKGLEDFSAAFGPLAAEVRKNVPGLDRMATAIEKAAGYTNGFGGALSAGQKKLAASLRDDATRLMDQFADPTAKLKKFADNLDQMQKFGAIDDRVKGLAFGAEVDRLLNARGRDMTRPAPAIEYGSQQFAQLVQQATAGGGRQDVVGAIRDMIREQRELSRIGQQQLDELRKMPAPQAVKMPGE